MPAARIVWILSWIACRMVMMPSLAAGISSGRDWAMPSIRAAMISIPATISSGITWINDEISAMPISMAASTTASMLSNNAPIRDSSRLMPTFTNSGSSSTAESMRMIPIWATASASPSALLRADVTAPMASAPIWANWGSRSGSMSTAVLISTLSPLTTLGRVSSIRGMIFSPAVTTLLTRFSVSCPKSWLLSARPVTQFVQADLAAFTEP